MSITTTETGFDSITHTFSTVSEITSNISKIKPYELCIATDIDAVYYKDNSGNLHHIKDYILPTATASVLGAVKVGSSLKISNDVLDVNAKTEKLTNTTIDVLSSSASRALFENGAGGICLGYIEDGGSHLVGEIWLSRNVKGEFKCLVANSDNYLDVTPGAEKWVQIDDLTNAGKIENLNAYKEIYPYTIAGSHSINISEAKNYKRIEIYLAMSQGTGTFHDTKAVNLILNYPYTIINLAGILGTDIIDSSLCYYRVKEAVPGTLTIEKSGVDNFLYARVRAFNKI